MSVQCWFIILNVHKQSFTHVFPVGIPTLPTLMPHQHQIQKSALFKYKWKIGKMCLIQKSKAGIKFLLQYSVK